MTVEGRRRDTAYITAVSDICHNGQRTAQLGAECGQAVSPPRREDRMSASRIEQPRGGRADSRRRTRDDHDSAGQLPGIHSGILSRGGRAARTRPPERTAIRARCP